MSNNPPFVVVELTKEEFEFLVGNCESNMEFAMKAMMSDPPLSRASLEKLVDLNEQFKGIRDKLKAASL